MADPIAIRPAEPEDAGVAAALLYSAYTHTRVTYPLLEGQASGWVEHLRDLFRQTGNRFSYQNALVAASGSQVVGIVLSFGGRDEARLNAAIGPWLEREAHDDEWYVDALAVLQDWSRQGIGTRLMQAAEEQARQHQYPKIALNVAVGNSEAETLYAHLNYHITGHGSLYGRSHVHMVKALDSAT